MKPFSAEIHPDDVGELVDLTVEDKDESATMAALQRQGVAALYNILCREPVAYLADEVGMGKTYQALALSAVVWNENPDARILFISPRANLQQKWVDEYQRFFATNYRRAQRWGDDRGSSTLFGQPLRRPVRFENLRAWTQGLGVDSSLAPFLRHTSFTRPVFVTSKDLRRLDALCDSLRGEFESWGLFHWRQPGKLTAANAPRKLNESFAQALNARLSEIGGDRPYFDLVIIDEAQCLRNPDNQTNAVLRRCLRGQSSRWLFMSATPVHGSVQDLFSVMNCYSGEELLDPSLVDDPADLQRELQRFMIRRPRKYHCSTTTEPVDKREYRRHDQERWAVRDAEMGVLETLSMGLVQKELVNVLDGRNNRFKIGFLSSFESLQSSLAGSRQLRREAVSGTVEDGERRGDWFGNVAEAVNDEDAPDAQFVGRYAADFEKTFGMPLPHAKIDALVRKVAPSAFGSETEPGGEKCLVFTRRVSTVETLRSRLELEHRRILEKRIRASWGVDIDWKTGSTGAMPVVEAAGDDESDDAAQSVEDYTLDHPDAADFFRSAMADGGWLNRYRRTFQRTGRNALFFEDGWLERLCRAGGVEPNSAADALPDELWAESLAHATTHSGGKRQVFRAKQLRYLALHGVLRFPQAFGLSNEEARPWQAAYEACLHEHLERPETSERADRFPGLFLAPVLWMEWDARFGTELRLPAADPVGLEPSVLREALYQRQVARTILSQVMRLTDLVVHLYLADEAGKRSPDNLGQRFVAWLRSSDAAAREFERDARDWLTHLRLIVDSCLDGSGRSWRSLAGQEVWDQLFQPEPVLGVTGGSGSHKTATRQFRTPSMPRVIVCTDTLKEGVDLHTFCDRVVHYGVAWTSGDLEQRIGRVDRYFSKVERRLRWEGGPPEVVLEVGYPHVESSLEKAQVERVIGRQRVAEALMDSPLAGLVDESKEMTVDGSAGTRPTVKLHPFGVPEFGARRTGLVSVSAGAAKEQADFYADWWRELVNALMRSKQAWSVSPLADRPVESVTVHRHGAQHELSWSFDAGLQRNILTISTPPWPSASGMTRARRSIIRDRRRVEEPLVRLLVPSPSEPGNGKEVAGLLACLSGCSPVPVESVPAVWRKVASKLAADGVEALADHKLRFVFDWGPRRHELTAYLYEHSVRVVGRVAAFEDLPDRTEWGAQGVESDKLRAWCARETSKLPLGYLDVHERDELVFGIHVLCGGITFAECRNLLSQVAWRADAWEAALTGQDYW